MTTRRTRAKLGCGALVVLALGLGWVAHDAVAGWLVDERLAGSLLAGGGGASELAIAAGFLLARVAASLALPVAGAMCLVGAVAAAWRTPP